MSKEKLELRDDCPVSINQKIEKVFQELYDHYRVVVNSNEYLRKENERLKSEGYKDEEMSKMKNRYDEMCADYYRGFPISEEEDERIGKWELEMEKKHPGHGGAIGGRFHFEFRPTSIGTIGVVVDDFTNEKLEFQSL